jgi:hypothetical protein
MSVVTRDLEQRGAAVEEAAQRALADSTTPGLAVGGGGRELPSGGGGRMDAVGKGLDGSMTCHGE